MQEAFNFDVRFQVINRGNQRNQPERGLAMSRFLSVLSMAAILASSSGILAETLPFDQKVETYHDSEKGVTVFTLRLEQPFLAGEFEKSNYLRLKPMDKNAWLVYPRETRFEQKHAEFYGRLRKSEADAKSAKLKLSYEMVSENLDGSRKVDVRDAEIEIPIPTEDGGPESLYQEWAKQQNAHFAELLRYYPENSFLEYVLLQSKDRYGVSPPPLPGKIPTSGDNDFDLYHVFGGGLTVQQSLQREVLSRGARRGDLTIHVSEISPPTIQSLDYEAKLKERQKDGHQPQPHETAKLVPADQYFLQFQSMKAADRLIDLSEQWGESVLRMFQVSARDHHLSQKYEDQLCIKRSALSKLFGDEVIDEFAVTGSDFYIAEGTDVSLIFRLKRPDVFRSAAESWLAETKQKWPELTVREFNYRGHQVAARYTSDRGVSSFVVYQGDYAIFSNSHRAIRRIVDTTLDRLPSLDQQLDYRYITTMLPAEDQEQTAYLYLSEAFLKRLISPEFKIAEKRRRQAFTNLVMLNNASLFYRLEHGESPESLSELSEGDFVDLSRIVDPAGGAYAFDARRDTATSSLYNRIKYLTPIQELSVLKVSQQERTEYQEYKRRYESVWRDYFDPIAVRITTEPNVKLETLVLPFANSGVYGDLQRFLDENPQALDATQYAESSVFSLALVPGRKQVGRVLKMVPGVSETLEANPTLTDLSWLGDRVSLHFCDDDTILEIDPTRLKPLKSFFPLNIQQQALATAAITATNLPVYLTVDVEDDEKARRLLDDLTSRVFLHSETSGDFNTNLDAYRLPDYKDHPVYVLSFQFYAAKVRLYLSLVNGRLAASTARSTLHQVIDAGTKAPAENPPKAHALLRMNFEAMDQLKEDLQIYWAEKARIAAHRNIMPLYTLVKLYDVSIEEANEIADAKYGVTYFCPGNGKYVYDAGRDQVSSTVFGNRRNARQQVSLDDDSPFAKFFQSLEEITASLRFEGDGLVGTVEIQRK